MAVLTDSPAIFEIIGDGFAPESGSFTNSEQSYSMVLITDYNDEEDMIKFLLGYSKKGATGLLERRLPVQHPRYPRLWATKVQTKPYIPSWDPAEVELADPFKGLKIGPDGPYPLYKKTQYTIAFNTVQFRSLTDEQIAAAPYSGKESFRFVKELSSTDVENIQLKQGIFRFFSGADPDAFPGAATEVPTVKPTIHLKSRKLTWTWMDVPTNYLFNAAGLPTGLDAINGKVNSVPFHGYPAGTLLALSPKYTPRDAPVNAVVLGLDPVDKSVPARYFDVEFTFHYIDPPTKPGYSFKGHCLSLYQKKDEPPFFYLITHVAGSSADGNRIYQSIDFETAFQAAT